MRMKTIGPAAAAVLASAAGLSGQAGRSYGPEHVWWEPRQGSNLPWEEDYDNPSGQLSILNTFGLIHTEHDAFFEPLGENGRACITCHQPANAMSISTSSVKSRWTTTQGKIPCSPPLMAPTAPTYRKTRRVPTPCFSNGTCSGLLCPGLPKTPPVPPYNPNSASTFSAIQRGATPAPSMVSPAGILPSLFIGVRVGPPTSNRSSPDQPEPGSWPIPASLRCGPRPPARQ